LNKGCAGRILPAQFFLFFHRDVEKQRKILTDKKKSLEIPQLFQKSLWIKLWRMWITSVDIHICPPGVYAQTDKNSRRLLPAAVF